MREALRGAGGRGPWRFQPSDSIVFFFGTKKGNCFLLAVSIQATTSGFLLNWFAFLRVAFVGLPLVGW